MTRKRKMLPLNVNKTKKWCIVTKENKIIDRFRLVAAAYQMKSLYESRFYQKLYIKKLKDIKKEEEEQFLFKEEFI